MRRNPFAADQRPAPTHALEYFTDREGFIQAFTRHLDTPAGEDLSVLVFYGVGGIGKTTLVRKLCADLSQAASPLPHARFNLENVGEQAQASRDVLLRLRSDLESDFHIQFPRFDLALAVLLAREGGEHPPLVRVSPGLGAAFSAAIEFTPSFIKAGVKLATQQIESVVQRSETLEHWVRQVGGTEAVLELSERFAQDDQIVQEELIRRFAQDLAGHLPVRPGPCRGVLFLDTYEALWTGRESSLAAQARLLDGWVRLLAEYLLGAGMLLVIAGRDRLGWGDDDPDWESCLDQHILGGVSAADAQTFLARRGIGVPPPLPPDPLQASILRCADTSAGSGQPAGCHLLALALSADIVQNTREAGNEPDPALFLGVPPAKMAGELATRFLKSLHNRNLELWVEALSLTPRFDEAAALALDAERQLHAGRAGWEQLRHYSFVTAQPDGFFRMHRTMREVLRARSSEAVTQTLQDWFAGYWQARGETSLAFYHCWSLHPEGQREAWADRHAAALAAGRTADARALLTEWAEVALDDDDRSLLSGPVWAGTHFALGDALWKTPQSPRQARLMGALQHFHSALSVWTEIDFPYNWAEAQHGLALVYQNLPGGDRTQNLRETEAHLRNALRVWTETAYPEKWADTQNRLGINYAYLPTGNRTENLRAGTECFKNALRFRTRDAWPQRWANLQNNIGCNFLLMPEGDKAENLSRAAAYFEDISQVQTEEVVPEMWAMTQHNLGIVYFDLAEGDRTENLQKSVAHYQAALRVHTEEDRPEVWAETQNGLGNALVVMPGGERLREAIACFDAALRVWTPEDNPDRWAQAQGNRGKAVMELTEGDRLQNLQAAMAGFEAALRVHTETDFPDHWAKQQENLGRAWQALAEETGDDTKRDSARACWSAAARGYRAVGLAREAEAVERLAGLTED